MGTLRDPAQGPDNTLYNHECFDTPEWPATILLDDINKTMVAVIDNRDKHIKFTWFSWIYNICPYPESHYV